MAETPETRTIHASCLCGKAAHSITLPARCFPLRTTLCHCDSCRHMTGTLAFCCAHPPEEYQPDPTLFDKLECFMFSEKIEQYFCGTCGAHVIERSTIRKGPESEWKITYGLMLGTLKKIDGICDLVGHIYVADTRDGGFADLLTEYEGKKLTRWAEYDDQDATLPLYWHDEEAQRVEPSDKLHGYCKCGGVQFWIMRAKKSLQEAKSDVKQPEPSKSGALCSPELAAWVRSKTGKYLACLCVCDSCRSQAGQEVTSWALVPTSDIFQDAEGKTAFSSTFGTLKTYQSSPGHTRSFCSKCGSRVFYQANKADNTVDVAVGVLDAAEGARASTWLDWQLHRIGFSEDAKGRADSLLLGLEKGVQDFVEAPRSL